MKYISTLALSVMTFFTVLTAQVEETLVRQCFDGYKEAVMEGRSEDAVAYLDQNSIEYFNDLLGLSQSADKATVQSLPLMDKMMVIAIRQNAPKDLILNGDATQILNYAIEEGLIGKNTVANNSIGAVKLDGRHASGQLVMGSTPLEMYFDFNQEGRDWKLDITSIFPATASTLESLQKLSGLEEDEYLFNLLETLTKSRPTDKVWDPVLQ